MCSCVVVNVDICLIFLSHYRNMLVQIFEIDVAF